MKKRSKNPSSGKLKVGFVFDDSLDSNDGVAQYVKTLGKWLGEHGHEVRYLVGETKLKKWYGGDVFSLCRNIGVSFNGNRLSTPLPASGQKIRKILNTENFDLLHVQVPYSPFMAQVVINNAQPTTAVVGTFHILPAGHLASWGTKLLRLVYGRSLKRIEPLLSVSAGAAIFAGSSLKRGSTVIPNVVELERFQKETKAVKRANRIVFLGRLVERKGCYQLLQAFLELSGRRDGLELVIAGDGPERQRLERFVLRHNLQKQVTFRGFIQESEKPSLLASADIACFPALYGESFGIVLIEAMAAGAGAVIGGNNDGYKNVLDGEVLFDPKDTQALSELIENILSNKDLAKKIHSKQQLQVRSYDVNLVGGKILRIYQEAVAKTSRKSHN